MSYKILISTSPGMPVDAVYESKIDFFWLSKAVWQPESLLELPVLEFKINQVKRIPDLISTGVFWLVSEKFSDLLRDHGILFESVPVVLSGKGTKLYNYSLFHLLQILPILDMEKSIIHARDNIEKIVIVDMEEKPELAMIRDSFLLSKVFVHDNLVEKIKKNKITGCAWKDPSEYSFSLPKIKWRYGGK